MLSMFSLTSQSNSLPKDEEVGLEFLTKVSKVRSLVTAVSINLNRSQLMKRSAVSRKMLSLW